MSREIRAQAMVLESMLMHMALPGVERPIVFPDLADPTDAALILLLDDRDPIELESFPSQIRVITADELESIRTGDDRTLLFEFLEPEQIPGTLGVRLRVSAAPHGAAPAPLGEVVATFDDRDPLIAVEPTHVLAY